MNWKIQLVLLFAKFRKPVDLDASINMQAMRKQAEQAAKLGTLLFDKFISVADVVNTKAKNIPLRIYKNSKQQNQRVIVYYHGGGFALYGLNSHDNVCRRLCVMNNCIVVSVEYRLAPEYSFPAAHEDAYEALLWVKEHIHQWGGDKEKIIVAGDSAGGNLAACMAHRCKKENISLLAQVLIYPWVDGKLNNPSIDKNGKGYLLTKETMFWFQQQYTPNKEDQCKPSVSPCYENDFKDLAPALIITAQYDPLLDDGYKYAQQLKAAGNKIQYIEYPELFHGFFNIPLVSKNAMQSYKDIREFLALTSP